MVWAKLGKVLPRTSLYISNVLDTQHKIYFLYHKARAFDPRFAYICYFFMICIRYNWIISLKQYSVFFLNQTYTIYTEMYDLKAIIIPKMYLQIVKDKKLMEILMKCTEQADMIIYY